MNAADSTSWAPGARNQFIKALRCFPRVDEITIGELHSQSSNNGGSCYNFKISRHSLVPQIAFVRLAF